MTIAASEKTRLIRYPDFRPASTSTAFRTSCSVGGRYDHGLVDLNDDPLATNQDALKTRTISIVAGVSFPLKGK